mmetsp:Transcript_25341/g.59299  ORF Transcript_25341/g.59299 Transcript_25341/m.59299 type:complete len:271 (+) Transcript_25341:475-1287(+)
MCSIVEIIVGLRHEAGARDAKSRAAAVCGQGRIGFGPLHRQSGGDTSNIGTVIINQRARRRNEFGRPGPIPGMGRADGAVPFRLPEHLPPSRLVPLHAVSAEPHPVRLSPPGGTAQRLLRQFRQSPPLLVGVHESFAGRKLASAVHVRFRRVVVQSAVFVPARIRRSDIADRPGGRGRRRLRCLHVDGLEGIQGLLRQLGLLPVPGFPLRWRVPTQGTGEPLHVLQQREPQQRVRWSGARHRIRRHRRAASPVHCRNLRRMRGVLGRSDL